MEEIMITLDSIKKEITEYSNHFKNYHSEYEAWAYIKESLDNIDKDYNHLKLLNDELWNCLINKQNIVDIPQAMEKRAIEVIDEMMELGIKIKILEQTHKENK